MDLDLEDCAPSVTKVSTYCQLDSDSHHLPLAAEIKGKSCRFDPYLNAGGFQKHSCGGKTAS